MNSRKRPVRAATIVAGASALIAVCAAATTIALASASTRAPTVTVRIEGTSTTLLAATTVHTHAGSITRAGAAPGACSATSAVGALMAATRGRWAGTWSSSYKDYFITTILGVTASGKHYYWDLLVNNLAASTGACGVHLHNGDQLLFADVSTKGANLPIAVRLISNPVVGQPFKVQVVSYDKKGLAKPLAGARVTAGAVSTKPLRHGVISARTGALGVATLTESRLGLIEIGATKHGYIRAASVPAQVSQTAP